MHQDEVIGHSLYALCVFFFFFFHTKKEGGLASSDFCSNWAKLCLKNVTLFSSIFGRTTRKNVSAMQFFFFQNDSKSTEQHDYLKNSGNEHKGVIRNFFQGEF